MEKRKAAAYEAANLRIQQQVPKAKAHAKILEELNKESKEKVLKNILQADHYNNRMAVNILIWPVYLRALYIIVYRLIYQMNKDHLDYPILFHLDYPIIFHLNQNLTTDVKNQGRRTSQPRQNHLSIVKQPLMYFVAFFNNKQD